MPWFFGGRRKECPRKRESEEGEFREN